jgi:hypothetical protein
LGRNFLEQLQPFSANRTLPIGEASEVAIGTRFVANKTRTDWIADAYENNRDGADFRLNNRRHQVGVGDQHVRSTSMITTGICARRNGVPGQAEWQQS